MQKNSVYAHIFNHAFFYILAVLFVVVSIVSYHRFVIKNDYIVEYEGSCDPSLEKCFIGCEDDACAKEYYFTEVRKYAPDLFNECGKDITECEDANRCLSNDRDCVISHCSVEIDGDKCKVPNQGVDFKNDNLINPGEKGILQGDIILNKNI